LEQEGNGPNGTRDSRGGLQHPGSANDVLEVTAANKNQALSLVRVICGR